MVHIYVLNVSVCTCLAFSSTVHHVMFFLGLSSHDYVLKIVPTIYEKLDGSTTFTYQYTWAYKVVTVFNTLQLIKRLCHSCHPLLTSTLNSTSVTRIILSKQ